MLHCSRSCMRDSYAGLVETRLYTLLVIMMSNAVLSLRKFILTGSRVMRKHRSTLQPGDKFSQLDWWSRDSVMMSALHSMNSLRVPLIHNSLLGLPVKATPTSCHTPYPLEGYDILDVGCGAGFLCEPLARLGAKVTGLEPSEEVAAVAVKHSKLDPEVTSRVEYRCQTLEAMRGEDTDRQFDCVVASEVVEHVTDVPLFLGLLTSFVKPGGYVILTTINRTLMSYLTAIIGAEYLLRLLPQGTHCWNQFRTPRELTRELEWNGVQVDWVQGMWFNPVTSKWAWSDSTSVNYALRARQTK